MRTPNWRLFAARSLVSFVLVHYFAVAQLPLVPARILQVIDETKRTVLGGNTYPLARAQFDRGVAAPDLPMNRMLLVLKRSPAQEAALQKLLDDQQDKASPTYHKWLTPEQFGQQFGPNDSDTQTVTAWLQSHGFQIGKVAKGRNIIEFSGVASQVQEAFHTSIHKYVVNGEEHWANANDPEIPTALTPVVAGIHTLHNFIKRPMIHIAEERIPAKLVSQGRGKRPTVTFTDGTHALEPDDYWKIYNVYPLINDSPIVDGSGMSVAVVGRSDLYSGLEDVSSFRNFFGLVYGGNVSTLLNGPDPGDLGGGEEAEATLDTSWLEALAPGANIDLVISATTNTTDGVDLSEAYIIDNDLADIITESFGSCEAAYTSTEAQGYATLAEQAAAQGITYLVASGDSGAEGCDDPDTETVATGPVSVSVLAATPFNVAVGGTIFNEDGQNSKYWLPSNGNVSQTALSYIPENVWNESCTQIQCGQDAGIWAGGGGASGFFTKPSWQSGVAGIPNDGHRDVPDVSLTAAAGHDPYLLCLEGSCQPDSQGNIFFAAVGGTSASTPSFAGIMALVDQKMSGRQGLANYVLYKLAAAEKLSSCNASNTSTLPASTCVFNDVTVGNNAVPGEAQYGTSGAPYQAGVGYDLASGLGSVNVANLVNNWNSVTFKPTTTTIVSVNPTTITHGQSVNVDLNVAANSGGGTPSGSVSLLGNTGAMPSTQTSIGVFPLVGGLAAPSISSLPGGTYTLTAQYSGDGTFAPSTSAPSVPVTVNPESSVTKLSAFTIDSNRQYIPLTSAPSGSFIYLRTNVSASSGQGTPTGNVDISGSPIDGLLLGSLALNSQGNTETPTWLVLPPGIITEPVTAELFDAAVGSYTLTANYNGDSSFTPSSSPPVNFTITQAPIAVQVSSQGSPMGQGAFLFANVNASGAGISPGGTVTFFLNGKQVGGPQNFSGSSSPYISATGALVGWSQVAQYLYSGLANGSYTVKAVYSGDQNYLAGSGSASISVQPDFSLFSGLSTVTITSPGGSATTTLQITALDGYNGTINFTSSSCSGLPAGATCSFSPASVKGSGTTTLTVNTTATTAKLAPMHRHNFWLAGTGMGLVCVFLVGGCSTRRRTAIVLALVLSAFLVIGMGCGGGSASPGPSSASTPPPPSTPTPVGNSNVTVTATSGSLTHTVTFSLTVQ
jgi:hypothetical protein